MIIEPALIQNIGEVIFLFFYISKQAMSSQVIARHPERSINYLRAGA